jgi:hypothetical protein
MVGDSGFWVCSILRLALDPGRFCDRMGRSRGAQRSRSDGSAGAALDLPIRSRTMRPARESPVQMPLITFLHQKGFSCLLPRNGLVWPGGWRVRFGAQAYLGARIFPHDPVT